MADRSKPPLIVGFDTQILIWGFRKKGTELQRQRAQWLYMYLDSLDSGFEVIVPVIALTEYLSGVPVQRREHVIASLTSAGYTLAQFDIDCTLLATKIFEDQLSVADRSVDGWRTKLRADTLIAATAARKGATMFYSNDAGCRAVATLAGMTARDLPDHEPTTQKHLWTED